MKKKDDLATEARRTSKRGSRCSRCNAPLQRLVVSVKHTNEVIPAKICLKCDK